LKKANENTTRSHLKDPERRRLLEAAGTGVFAATFGSLLSGLSRTADAQEIRTLRWGVVGTGGIANRVTPMIQQASHAEVTAVSSRKMETAKIFADKHRIDQAFDSWAEMAASDGLDAVYVATPTSVREEICLAFANSGKHVLGEKPFANLPSLQRITSACRANGVGFMDGTHFVHEPRTEHIRSGMLENVGWPWSVASAFQFKMFDRKNIRLMPEFEPYGAIGDAGWYNMRAAVEYLPPDVEIASVQASHRTENINKAVTSGSGLIVFDDGSTTTWNCGFESGAVIMDLRISGAKGVVKLDDFVLARPADQAASYDLLTGWDEMTRIEVPAPKPAAALMFENFAIMTGSDELIEASIRASERTQKLLDAVWRSSNDD
jgi:predicted dehydrogenase